MQCRESEFEDHASWRRTQWHWDHLSFPIFNGIKGVHNNKEKKNTPPRFNEMTKINK